MATKQRLACGAAILRSIDARRQWTGNRKEFLALEQAIVDRELMELTELVAGGLCDEKCLNLREMRSEGKLQCARARSENSPTGDSDPQRRARSHEDDESA